MFQPSPPEQIRRPPAPNLFERRESAAAEGVQQGTRRQKNRQQKTLQQKILHPKTREPKQPCAAPARWDIQMLPRKLEFAQVARILTRFSPKIARAPARS